LKRLLEALDRDREGLMLTITKRVARARRRLLNDGASNAESRVSKYFGLAYAAGYFAIKHGILPITTEWLRESIAFGYERHLAAVAGQSADDPVAMLRQALDERADRLLDTRINQRWSDEIVAAAAGYRTRTAGTEEFFFTKEQFVALLPTNISGKRMCDALKRRMLLIHDEGSSGTTKNQTKRRIPKETKRLRGYCISGRILDTANSS
jgi:hypothetical protein